MKTTSDRIKIGHFRVLTLTKCKTLSIDKLQTYYDNHACVRTLGSGSKDNTLKHQNDYMDKVKSIIDGKINPNVDVEMDIALELTKPCRPPTTPRRIPEGLSRGYVLAVVLIIPTFVLVDVFFSNTISNFILGQ